VDGQQQDASGPPTEGGWTGRSIGVAWGMRICAWCARWLGRWPAYVLVTPVLLYYFLFSGRGRAASREYLARVLGPSRGPRAWWRSFRQYHAFALALVDRYLLLLRGRDAFEIVEEGKQAVVEAAAEGRGLVVLTSHLGNADLAGPVLGTAGVPLAMVRVDAERPEVRAIYEGVAEGRLPRVIELGGEGPSTLKILAALRHGEVVGMMGDRLVDGAWIEAPFLGRPAPFPAGPFVVAATAGVPLVSTFCFKEGAGRYRVISSPPWQPRFDPARGKDEQVAAWVAEYARTMEAYARRYPYQWFNFFSIWDPVERPERRPLDRVRRPPPPPA